MYRILHVAAVLSIVFLPMMIFLKRRAERIGHVLVLTTERRKCDKCKSYNLFRNMSTYAAGIPKLLHQTWETPMIPIQFADYTRSWQKDTDLKYLFTTSNSSRMFIRDCFRRSSGLHDSYRMKIQRADVRRYFLLYHFGGVYADLDLELIKPLRDVLDSYPCVLSQEPIEHQYLLWYPDNQTFKAMNTFMACRPRHPFFSFLINQLPVSKKKYPNYVMRSTGPMFLSEMYGLYKQNKSITQENDIILAIPEWFLPNFNWKEEGVFRYKCMKDELNTRQRALCEKLEQQGFKNLPLSNESFTLHHWAHTYSNSFQSLEQINIRDVRPDVMFL